MAKTSPPNRQPRDEQPAALPELAVLPVFYRLAGKRVLVIGGSQAAAWKVELLASTHAQVDVVAESFDSRIETVAQNFPATRLIQRAWRDEDFANSALAIVETESEAEAQKLRDAAQGFGVHLNVIDKPRWSDFQFGAMVERSPLVIAISTDGAAPVFGQTIRARIETLLPHGLKDWARAARDWRARVTALGLDLHGRRRVWETFTRRALSEPARAPDEADLAAMLASAEGAQQAQSGEVLLVGAGPGDPELLTLRAVRALQGADVVLYDDLVAPQVLDMARREAQRISVGKRGFKPSCTQEDICSLLVELGLAGKKVVRLKGGDPMVFGRALEEISALREAGIPVAVVPGVTTASAAAAALGFSLTGRETARRLQFVTAHARGGHLPADLNWAALADPGATTVVYMGVRTLPELAARLIAEGLPAQTPAIAVEWVSRKEQRNFSASIAGLPEKVAAAKITGPALIVIGNMLGGVGSDENLS